MSQRYRYRDSDDDVGSGYYEARGRNARGATFMGPFSRDDYTVGWICAIPLEMAAARAMLDNIHVELPNQEDDRNAYTFGELSGHYVVIACLPFGTYGTTSAALVASQMRSSFPSVRFYLMVGIGGGVPSEAVDIRLGDIVISRPTGRYSGVLQYDFGKAVAGGRFERIGALDKPPLELLTATSKLQSRQIVEGNPILDLLSDAIERYPQIQKTFTYPGQHQDLLFEAEYDHERGGTCRSCSKEWLVKREVRPTNDPTIHYGLIASGNQVMKDGRTRDRLAKELDIYCFEMEAAGLMDGFGCLVIRGICDYSDSHKNKQWQGYAAATAAAYAKALLDIVPKIGKGKRQDAEQMRISCLRSLSFQNIDARFYNIATAHQNTCNWLFKTPQFRRWEDRTNIETFNGVLWIKGKPGTGKSTLMKHALEYCRTASKFKGHSIIAYFFNARGTNLEKTCLGMLRSLVCQLIEQDTGVCSMFIPKYIRKEEMHGTTWQWHIDELKVFMFQTMQHLKPKPIILFADALDECEESEVREAVSFFEKLSYFALSAGVSLSVLLSSRHYPTIRMHKMLELVVESQAEHDQDISIYVRDKLTVTKDADKIEKELLRKAEGIFMWVVLVTEMLNQAFDEGRITAVWKRLRDVPTDLDEVFRILLEKDNHYMNETLLMLQWVLFAPKPLTPMELYYGVIAGTEPDLLKEHNHLEVTYESIARFITSCSRGLIEIRQSSQTVQFIHETVNDFLLRNKRLQSLDPTLSPHLAGSSHGRLADCCIAYLEMEDLATVSIPTSPSDIANIYEPYYPFMRYVVHHIFYHAELSCTGNKTQQRFLRRLFKQPRVFQLLKYFHDQWKVRYQEKYGRDSTLLYVLSLRGDRDLVKTLLSEKWIDVNAECGHFGNALQAALSIAAQHGTRADIVQMLLDAGADVNAIGAYGSVLQTAISNSAIFGPFDCDTTVLVICKLLDAGADVNARSGPYANALQAACAYTHYDLYKEREQIVTILLDAGADANAQGGEFGNALQATLENFGHVASGRDPDPLPVQIVKMLLNAGADPNHVGGGCGNPLLAAIHRATSIIERRNSTSDDSVKPPYTYGGPRKVSEAAPTDIIDILLSHGADVNAPVKHYGTALQAAAFLDCQHPPFGTLLTILGAGADITARNGHYGGVLQAVIARVIEFPKYKTSDFSFEVLKKLVEHGADVNALGGPYGSVLHAAVRCPQKNFRALATELLLQAGANPNVGSGKFASVSKCVALRGSGGMLMELCNCPGGKLYHNVLYDSDGQRLCKRKLLGIDDGGALGIFNMLIRYGALDAAEEKKKLYEFFGWEAFKIEAFEKGGYPLLESVINEKERERESGRRRISIDARPDSLPRRL
ncbi:hypothetical protein TWF225_006839 [Orbilia oligospora]|uniref:Uncharacterized protein n=2 Tax=Orbilia oligospora TaxID=2813651 RepID=A0A7C8TUW9_ORBOL|nr:hypothetical protein TWF751_008424 [Orbilia oligospora]KAF3194286.1 hypothetical protein TWF225_006839 [Orbilia oligospora]KAF3235628.1 hypothetical protein TWF217_003098 [Orbilia oligospora]KAF3240778.1 hypothetical protein TWF128_011202 [Orbilia oligospora]KAF3240779.1 hypothetical protein TWF128_011202 [Orbilia oligospora]